MFGPFLTLQFSTQTGKETSTRKDYGLKKHFLEYAYVCLFCCVGGLVAVVHSFLICQFCSAGTQSRTIYSVLCHVKDMHTCTQTHSVSLPLSTVPFGEWSQSVDTGGSQLCPSCLGVTVTEFLQGYCLQSADRHNQQVMGHLQTAATAYLTAERN